MAPKLRSLSGPWEEEEDGVELQSIGDQMMSSVTLLRLRNMLFVLNMETTEIWKIAAGNYLFGLPYASNTDRSCHRGACVGENMHGTP